MTATEVYRPDQWHEFFLTVGGGAAALTGLVFVARSLNLDVIASDATHRYRAIGTLSGFTAAFMVCALALLGGHDHRAVGAEWFVVPTVAGAIYVYGYAQAIRTGGSSVGLRPLRLIVGTSSSTWPRRFPLDELRATPGTNVLVDLIGRAPMSRVSDLVSLRTAEMSPGSVPPVTPRGRHISCERSSNVHPTQTTS